MDQVPHLPVQGGQQRGRADSKGVDMGCQCRADSKGVDMGSQCRADSKGVDMGSQCRADSKGVDMGCQGSSQWTNITARVHMPLNGCTIWKNGVC